MSTVANIWRDSAAHLRDAHGLAEVLAADEQRHRAAAAAGAARAADAVHVVLRGPRGVEVHHEADARDLGPKSS